MPTNYGLEVRGNAGNLQIYRGAVNYVFKRKHTGLTHYVEGPSYNHRFSYRVPTLSNKSLVVIRPATATAKTGISDGNYADGYRYHYFDNATGGTLDAWEFGPSETVDEQFGMRVWDAAGNLTFNSGEGTMKIGAYANAPHASSPFKNNYAVPAASGGIIYGVFLLGSMWWSNTAGTQHWTEVRLSGTQFLFTQRTRNDGGVISSRGDPNAGFMLVDITEYMGS
jgi:hypothetical protein